MILSHSDHPHSGNIDSFAPEGSTVEFVAWGATFARSAGRYYNCEIDGQLDIAGRQFSFIDPPLADRSHTTWIYDQKTRYMFTADGFGSYHDPEKCRSISAYFETGIPMENLSVSCGLDWLRYVDTGKLRAALESVFAEYPVEFVAPIHGHLISGDDLDRYIDQLIEAATRIEAGYSVPEPE